MVIFNVSSTVKVVDYSDGNDDIKEKSSLRSIVVTENESHRTCR